MKITFLSALLLVGSCTTLRYSEKIKNIENGVVFEQPEIIKAHANTINQTDLKLILSELSSDKYEGRRVGQKGHEMAAAFVKNFYKSNGIKPLPSAPDYAQIVPAEYLGEKFGEKFGTSENVIAFIEGTDYKDEFLIIGAHLDHEGIIDGEIYNGADDNASGTAAVMEIAQALQIAAENGYGPKRSVIFLHVTAEEVGLQGSRYYTENPLVPLEQTVAMINIDMIGRTDKKHQEHDEYIYPIGFDRHSLEFPFIIKKANNIVANLDLDYRFNEKIESNQYFYRSDHYNFALKDIPVVFFFNGEHEDYHKATDTEDKINYPLLEKRTKYIFTVAWYIANMDHRMEIDFVQ